MYDSARLERKEIATDPAVNELAWYPRMTPVACAYLECPGDLLTLELSECSWDGAT